MSAILALIYILIDTKTDDVNKVLGAARKKAIVVETSLCTFKVGKDHNCLVFMQIPNVVLIIAIVVGTPCLHTEYK